MDTSEREQLAERVLAEIRQATKRSMPVSQLCSLLTTDFASIKAAVQQLADWGYGVQQNSEAVELQSVPDVLNDIEIGHHLKTKLIGQAIHAYQSIGSTNDAARKLAEAGAAEGTIVVADQQTQGRGRFARNWFSPPRTGINLSIILRPSFSPAEAPGLSLMASVALAETLQDFVPHEMQLKWPNDVLIGGKKVAGILVELSAEQDRIEHVVVGVGINVNQAQDAFPPEIAATATSVSVAGGTEVRRVKLIRRFLEAFELRYLQYQDQRLLPMLDRLRSHSTLLGHRIKLAHGDRITEALAVDIDESGGLVIDSGAGRRVVTSGEVTIVKD